ncbi:ribonuclease HIII [Anaerorhabdus sp.]|jgi:ribonuclease HIII|uniref:ribonuclease HIII n=1 Tax=Anaerorhabdus sp. TaxID=1872524 RepID=UPI002FC83EB8
MSTITLVLTDTQINKLKTTFSESIVSKTPPYALYQLKVEGCVITAYESKKVVFQGSDAEVYASPFQIKNTFKTQAGSDEVGTGDYFGPICVCACIVTNKNKDALAKYAIQDSKALKDDYIQQIAPQIMKTVEYSLLILDNAKYNQVQATNNMNQIKAKLHNQAYVNLAKKTTLPNFIIIDQFTPEKLYYNYIKNEPNIIRNIHFETKAENKYLAVACASVIARHAFLECLKNYETHYDMTFQKGASDKVDQNAAEFVKRYGIEELKNVAKLHFKNTEKLKEYL